MKKPDRWERMVENEYSRWLKGQHYSGWLTIPMKLLRKEHAWVRRMVNAHNQSIQGFTDHELDADWKRGYKHACLEILNKLKERAQ